MTLTDIDHATCIAILDIAFPAEGLSTALLFCLFSVVGLPQSAEVYRPACIVYTSL